jgi:hypothetical protein
LEETGSKKSNNVIKVRIWPPTQHDAKSTKSTYIREFMKTAAQDSLFNMDQLCKMWDLTIGMTEPIVPENEKGNSQTNSGIPYKPVHVDMIEEVPEAMPLLWQKGEKLMKGKRIELLHFIVRDKPRLVHSEAHLQALLKEAEAQALKERLLINHQKVQRYPEEIESQFSPLSYVKIKGYKHPAHGAVTKIVSVWPPKRIDVPAELTSYTRQFTDNLIKAMKHKKRPYAYGNEDIISVRHYVKPGKEWPRPKVRAVSESLPEIDKSLTSIQRYETDRLFDGPMVAQSYRPECRLVVITKQSIKEAVLLLAKLAMKDLSIEDLLEAELLKLRIHLSPSRHSTREIERYLPASTPTIEPKQKELQVCVVEVGAVTPASRNATLSSVARAGPSSNRTIRRLLPRPPRDILGLTAGYDCAGVRVVFDSGAAVSLISYPMMAELGATLEKLTPEQSRQVLSAEGESMRLIGYIKAVLLLATGCYPHKFYVRAQPMNAFQRQKQIDLLIGCDLLSKIGVCIIDFKHSTLTIKDSHNRSSYSYDIDTEDGRCLVKVTEYMNWKIGEGRTLAQMVRDTRSVTLDTDDEEEHYLMGHPAIRKGSSPGENRPTGGNSRKRIPRVRDPPLQVTASQNNATPSVRATTAKNNTGRVTQENVASRQGNTPRDSPRARRADSPVINRAPRRDEDPDSTEAGNRRIDDVIDAVVERVRTAPPKRTQPSFEKALVSQDEAAAKKAAAEKKANMLKRLQRLQEANAQKQSSSQGRAQRAEGRQTQKDTVVETQTKSVELIDILDELLIHACDQAEEREQPDPIGDWNEEFEEEDSSLNYQDLDIRGMG